MTALRITQGSTQSATIARVQASAGRLAAAQERLSSGNKISKPSDNPAGATAALSLQSQIRRNTQYAAASSDALSFLTTADTAYKQIITQTQAAQTLVLQGMNTGATSADAAAALANQVDAIRNGVLALANTSYNGQAVFAGTASGTAAFDSSGTYVGDSGAVNRMVGAGNTVQVNQTGTDVFGADGNNLFSILSDISSALRTDPSTLGTQLTRLQNATIQLGASQATEGAAYNQVTAAQEVSTTAATQLKTSLSDVVEIDFAQSVIDVSSANTAYQAALQTTATISQRSLLDFLR